MRAAECCGAAKAEPATQRQVRGDIDVEGNIGRIEKCTGHGWEINGLAVEVNLGRPRRLKVSKRR